MVGVNKKTAKGRLDKYYHLAKEQGYRARSAFKLIQLNRKYRFLESSRVLIDLCAAPGGWLQVASKYMPMSHLIIGVDLVPIKPIPGVITLAADITGDTCRSLLKKEIKDWKVDVVLHDGAPNVGSAWIHDAYSQAELVLMSLKLATEFLRPGGIFITKVFRSKDYNALMWVFTQLFKKVEATKPASSRNVSAEIFVVCQDYLAPKKIDPKFLDPKSVFQDIEVPARPINILHPERHVRQREGYEDGVTVLFKVATVRQYLEAEDPGTCLGTFSKLDFGTQASDLKLAQHSATNDDIKHYCEDLKILGRREFKALLKWRLALRKAFPEDFDANLADAGAAGPTFLQVAEAKPLSDTEELDALIAAGDKKAKKQRKKLLLKRAKQRQRMKLGMDAEKSDLVDTRDSGLAVDQELFSLSNLKQLPKDDASSSSDSDGEMEFETVAFVSRADVERDEPARSSPSGTDSDGNDDLDVQMEEMYARYKEKMALSKSAKRQAASEASAGDSDSHEGEEAEENDQDLDSSSSGSEDAAEQARQQPKTKPNKLLTSMLNEEETKSAKLHKASLLFSLPVFQKFQQDEESRLAQAQLTNQKSMPKRAQFGPDDNDNGSGSDNDDKDLDTPASGRFAKENKKKASQRAKRPYQKGSESDKQDEERSGGIEFVKADPIPEPVSSLFTEKDKMTLLTPEGMSLALQIRSKDKRVKKALIDSSFGRYTFDDTAGAPSWFREDEQKHSRQQRPVTKEAIDVLREKLKSIDSRPTKKTLEAKMRNKARAMRKLERIKAKAGTIAESEELSEAQKSGQIQKMLRNAMKKKQQRATLVVARGSNKGKPSRPHGVKGRYKMVDARMKKEARALKRTKKHEKGKRR